MNGQLCRVVGFTSNYATNPDMRLQCKIEGDDGICILLKSCNLVPTDSRIMWDLSSASEPLTDTEIIKGLKQVLSKHSQFESTDRVDLRYRLNWYRNVLIKLENKKKEQPNSNGNELGDDEYCFPCGAIPPPDENEGTFEWIMRVNRPACIGNNKVDLRYLDLGLKGDGLATCSICNEIFGTSEKNLVTLPCVHQFHTTCLQEWLQSDLGRLNWNCPTCRHIVPSNLTTYIVQYTTELRNRFQEYPLSGFCQKCILWYMERDRNQVLHGCVNEHGEERTMNEMEGQTSEKMYLFPPSAKR